MGKPHTIGETLIKPAVREVIKTVLNQDPTEVLSVVPLSNDAVARRIDELGQNVEMQLCEELKIPAISQINLKKRYSEIIQQCSVHNKAC